MGYSAPSGPGQARMRPRSPSGEHINRLFDIEGHRVEVEFHFGLQTPHITGAIK
jgi:hypothetical protein